jgi:NAD(P)-dependent dehydrogenase (short-subunit alcohol dehydrogenase family)
METMTLKGKVALVTGAASKRGMGHAIALKLAGEGANVVVADKFASPKSFFPGDEGWGGLDAEVSEIKALGRDAMSTVLDVANSLDVDRVVANVVQKMGKIDILVHCAAIRGPVGVPVVDLDEKDWRNIVDIDLTGAYLVSKAVAKTMVARGQGGKIVMFASLAGTKGVPGSGAYGAAKSAVISLAKTMAIELAKHHINVNAINPGMIVTNLRDETFEKMRKAQGVSWEDVRKKDHEMLSKNVIPWGRLGTPQEIADLVYFLVSDLSTYVTGEAIAIGGGVT